MGALQAKTNDAIKDRQSGHASDVAAVWDAQGADAFIFAADTPANVIAAVDFSKDPDTETDNRDGQGSAAQSVVAGLLAPAPDLVGTQPTSKGMPDWDGILFRRRVRDKAPATVLQPEIPLPCFTPGVHIMTPRGERPIETLQLGDKVVTRDHGLQPIRWIGRKTVAADGAQAPIQLHPGAIKGLAEPLLVSPQHRMLFQGYRSQLLFGESEVLVAAEDLLDGRAVTRREGGSVTYMHLLFDSHEVIYANGAPSESLLYVPEMVDMIAPSSRSDLYARCPDNMPELGASQSAARRCLRDFETQMLQMS